MKPIRPILFGLLFSAQFLFAISGTGTYDDPYTVATASDLATISGSSSYWTSGIYIEQTADIDLSGYADWTPIAPSTSPNFAATYDGNGYKIIGLTCISTGYRGVFGLVTGTIKNLGVSGSITNGTYAGMLVGRSNGTVENCYSSGTISGSTANSYYGGLVGWCSSGTISKCYSTVAVSNGASGMSAGGLVGYGGYGSNVVTIQNCYATGNVTQSSTGYAGGFIGYSATANNSITNCYSTGAVSATYQGGFAGRYSAGTFTGCFFDYETAGTSTVCGSGTPSGTTTAATTTEMKTASMYIDAGWSTSIWHLVNGSYPNFGTTSLSVTFTDGSGFVPTITKGSTDQTLGRFKLTGDASTLTAASIQLNGTRSGLSNLKLWSSGDATFESGSDTQLDGPESDGSSVSFSGFSSAIATGGTYYFITGDVASDASGSVQGVIIENASLTLSGGSLTGTIANAPLSNGDASLPVDLSSFSAVCQGQSVILEWVTESETDNLGFILERALVTHNFIPPKWEQIASYQTNDALKGQGNTSSKTEYSFTDNEVEPGTAYQYRVSDVSTDGKVTVYASLSIEVDALPEVTAMEKAYPNPFNPSTYICYHLAEDSQVEISVYDMLGRKVQTLFSGQQLTGSYHVYWNGKSEAGNIAPTGTYLIRMQTENTAQVQKVLLMK